MVSDRPGVGKGNEPPSRPVSSRLSGVLLQARRPTDPMKTHEYRCFLERTGLAEDQLDSFDLTQEAPSLAGARAYDVVFVGGSGEFYVSKADLPHFEGFLDFLREITAVGHPLFCACYGYQAMVVALGGEVVFDPENTEVGTYSLALTPEGKNDPLFTPLPDPFHVQMGHKDRALRHPPGVPNLAASDQAPLQALRLPDLPIWAVQFHPELTGRTNLDRYHHYLKGYSSHLTEEEVADVTSRFRDSPEASELLGRFLTLVF